jgi:anti-sigma factor RsiW
MMMDEPMSSSEFIELDLDSQLVLYIAGELTNGAKAALERRLAADPKLAAELARLRETQLFCADALKAGDEQLRLPVSEGVAVRRVGRVMAQWQVDRARMVAATAVKSRRIPVWAYPAAAAAILIIGFLVWSSRQPIALPPAADNVARETNVDDQPDPQDALADWIDTSFGNTQEAANTESALSDPISLPGTDEGGSASILPMPEETIQ